MFVSYIKSLMEGLTMREFIKINQKDNVIVALKNLQAGTKLLVDDKELELKEDIARGHKISTTSILKNSDIIKYGFPIGHATTDLQAGVWVHTQNTKTNLSGIEEYSYLPQISYIPVQNEKRTFKGYKRKNGNIGIRNELFIVPTVGCVNGIADLIVKEFIREVGDIAPFENIQVIKHNYGCSQLGDDHEYTKTILGNAATHPNAGGVLVLGLGCENNIIEDFKESLGSIDESRVKFLSSQSVSNEIDAGVALLKEIYTNARNDVREDVPLSELKVGLKCGGSDGFSGITANPLLGRFSDFLIAQGGTTVLTEVPEMFGAEKILMERAETEEVFHKTVSLINDFKEYFLRYNQPVYENPSPGNKLGGITTLEDKSLGCTQKAGSAAVVDVLKYGEKLAKDGLNLLSAPGNDLVATSALGAAGCQLVLFTTGRGTPFGSFVPTIKVSTNTPLYQDKSHWIDFNAGSLLENVEEEAVLQEFINYIIAVASGQLVNHEKNEFREIAIFKDGVTL